MQAGLYNVGVLCGTFFWRVMGTLPHASLMLEAGAEIDDTVLSFLYRCYELSYQVPLVVAVSQPGVFPAVTC